MAKDEPSNGDSNTNRLIYCHSSQALLSKCESEDVWEEDEVAESRRAVKSEVGYLPISFEQTEEGLCEVKEVREDEEGDDLGEVS